jgi:hypothetical protein
MSGGFRIGVMLLSMGWLFFAFGAAMNFYAWRQALVAREGERTPSGVPFLPGVAGSLSMFFTLPALARFGYELSWPWLWILAPLFLDVYCLGGFVLALFGFTRR